MATLKNVAQPQTRKELQSFGGLDNYCQRLVPHFTTNGHVKRVKEGNQTAGVDVRGSYRIRCHEESLAYLPHATFTAACKAFYCLYRKYPTFALQSQKKGKRQTTQTEGEASLLEDGELLRQLFASFEGVPLFSSPASVQRVPLFRRCSLS